MIDGIALLFDERTVQCVVCGWVSLMPMSDTSLLSEVVGVAQGHVCPLGVGMVIVHESQLAGAPVGTVVMATHWDDDVEALRRWVWVRTHRSDEPMEDQWQVAGDPAPPDILQAADLTVLHVGDQPHLRSRADGGRL